MWVGLLGLFDGRHSRRVLFFRKTIRRSEHYVQQQQRQQTRKKKQTRSLLFQRDGLFYIISGLFFARMCSLEMAAKCIPKFGFGCTRFTHMCVEAMVSPQKISTFSFNFIVYFGESKRNRENRSPGSGSHLYACACVCMSAFASFYVTFIFIFDLMRKS